MEKKLPLALTRKKNFDQVEMVLMINSVVKAPRQDLLEEIARAMVIQETAALTL